MKHIAILVLILAAVPAAAQPTGIFRAGDFIDIDISTARRIIWSVDTTGLFEAISGDRLKRIEDQAAGTRDSSRTWRTYLSSTDPDITIDSTTPGLYLISVAAGGSSGRAYLKLGEQTSTTTAALDSLGALYTLTVANYDSETTTGYTNFSNSAVGDSTVFQLNGSIYKAHPLTLNTYLERVTIMAYNPTYGTYGATASLVGIPVVSNDSCLVFHAKRTAIALEFHVLKRSNDLPPSFALADPNNVLVRIESFPLAALPPAGNSVQLYINVRMKRAYP